jgi:hypothetical protein
MSKQIDKLIINFPYEEPKYYWHYDREHRSFERREGRRPAGYVVATPDSKGFDDPGVFVPIELANKIRPRIKAWRENDYPGVSGITRRLLHHWQDPEEREIRDNLRDVHRRICGALLDMLVNYFESWIKGHSSVYIVRKETHGNSH